MITYLLARLLAKISGAERIYISKSRMALPNLFGAHKKFSPREDGKPIVIQEEHRFGKPRTALIQVEEV